MGYYTDYRLIIHGDVPAARLNEWARAIQHTDNPAFGIADMFDGDGMKWYDHHEDMLTLSREFPDVTFELHGDGEESLDLWVKYFRNGEVEAYEAEWKPPLCSWLHENQPGREAVDVQRDLFEVETVTVDGKVYVKSEYEAALARLTPAESSQQPKIAP